MSALAAQRAGGWPGEVAIWVVCLRAQWRQCSAGAIHRHLVPLQVVWASHSVAAMLQGGEVEVVLLLKAPDITSSFSWSKTHTRSTQIQGRGVSPLVHMRCVRRVAGAFRWWWCRNAGGRCMAPLWRPPQTA